MAIEQAPWGAVGGWSCVVFFDEGGATLCIVTATQDEGERAECKYLNYSCNLARIAFDMGPLSLQLCLMTERLDKPALCRSLLAGHFDGSLLRQRNGSREPDSARVML